MIRAEEFVTAVFAALGKEPRMNLARHPIQVEFQEGVVTLTGEVEDVASKKIALELAAATPQVTGIVDRLRVEPAERMEDGAIRDHVSHAFMGESAFNSYSLRTLVKGEWETVRMVEGGRVLEIEVAEGVVTLNGKAESLSHKRLAGVLAWWVPGSRDVVNGLEISPPEEDNPDEVVDAIRLVLEKDPLVNASQVKVYCRDLIVTLTGSVASERSRKAAESDAWFVFGVDGVVNELVVIP
ncbi:BON domain-containing protein [Geomesophilobacter sediminis]|uniref:BON domain-containing protein n=1 Tax=Geomesophilobacter sediminis TaxID=2798584 RepID=A0A8J7M1J2_9BACT|nr:BON domain-containing protein [Geomesophilobacter sediminis]MBJ6726961.1 BON domain-containing protein [Geomesophilobacter sediminis]